MKKHEEFMVEEVKKNKLLSENEVLEKQKRELVATIKELRREVSVHGGDYEAITKERIHTINESDEKFVSLKIRVEETEEKRKFALEKVKNLQNSAKKLENDLIDKEEEKSLLENEIENLKKLSKNIRLSKEEYENEKRLSLKGVLDELHEAKQELSDTKKEYKEKMEEIQKETRLMGIRRNDLEIYEARLIKKYPNEKFILK